MNAARSAGYITPSLINISGGPYVPNVAALAEIDWDFIDVKTNHSTHGLHPYPAKYIPQIPNILINKLSSVGETVADIFCGSGTTLVEALASQRHAIGVDANPLACLVSEAKTTRLQLGDEMALLQVAERAQRLSNTISPRASGPLIPLMQFVSAASRPDQKAISFWFDPFVVEELAEALSWCHALPTASSRTVALATFSSIIVAVSKQDSDTRYVRRDKRIAPGDTLRRFARALADATAAVAEFTRTVDPELRCMVHSANLLDGPDIGPVDLVVCSPPYPNAYSYHLYHMTRMVWLGMDQPKFKRQEIGSHRKYSSTGANSATVETFKCEMGVIFNWLRVHLRAGRYACFVMGDSTIRGARIDNAELLSSVAAGHGFTEAGRFHRSLQSTKKAFNPAIGKIKTEHVIVLRNEG